MWSHKGSAYHASGIMCRYIIVQSLTMNELGTINIYVLVCGSGQAHGITLRSITCKQ